MIKYLLRKASSPFLFLLAFFLLFTCFSFFLIKSKANNDCSLYGNNQVFSLLPFSSLEGDAYYRVELDAAMPREKAPLLLRCLFPSHSILSPWGISPEPQADVTPVVFAASPKPLSPADAENFRREINLQQDMERLEQILSAQPGNPVCGDHKGSLLTDDLDLKALVKPTGKLMINPQYPRYCFPISWPFFFRDSFGDPRPGGRLHIGIDIFAEEGTQVYAMTDGVIQQLADWHKAGNTLLLAGNDGRGYIYMHLQRYAEGITAGKAVKKGELIAYVGHTGTISTPPHLHFQVHADQSFSKICAMDPYEALVSLCQGHGVTDLGQPRPRFSMARGPENLPFGSVSASASASKTLPRKEYFQVVKGMVSVKKALIKSWDVKSTPAQEPGLVWRVANPTWKVPRADLKVPEDGEASTSSTRVTWTLPKPKSSSSPYYQSGQ